MSIDLAKALSIFINNFDMFMHGVMLTLLFAFVGTIVGLLIGLVIGGIRAIEINETDSNFIIIIKKVSQLFTRFYIWVLRGTPMMVQALFFYYFLKPVFHWNYLTAGLTVISVNTGAYMAEIIRSGIQSISKGQSEAAKSLGMSSFDALIYIIFPQAIKNSFPSIGNQLIVNIKDSSMLNVLSITELFFQTSSIAGSNYRYIETYLVSAVIYLILTSLASLLLNYTERRINKSDRNSHVDFCS